jgi:hypothetical protein
MTCDPGFIVSVSSSVVALWHSFMSLVITISATPVRWEGRDAFIYDDGNRPPRWHSLKHPEPCGLRYAATAIGRCVKGHVPAWFLATRGTKAGKLTKTSGPSKTSGGGFRLSTALPRCQPTLLRRIAQGRADTTTTYFADAEVVMLQITSSQPERPAYTGCGPISSS